MRPRRFAQVDVFASEPHRGNPVAVVLDGLFAEDGVLVEDPVTGSLNAALAVWLLSTGRLTAPYVARQGTRLGREGRVHVTQDPKGAVGVAGASHNMHRGPRHP